jgi:bacteriorhodopsin
MAATSIPTIPVQMLHEKAAAATYPGVLAPDDWVGFTFMLATGIMLASTFFFFLERDNVPAQWRPSVTVAGLVTGVAFWNYTFMRAGWLEAMESPLVYRYCDWIITVPLQILEFYFILSAGQGSTGGTFWSLITSSLLMLVFGYLGEAGFLPWLPAWVLGCICWFFIIWYTFSGEAATLVAKGSAAQQEAFGAIRMIVTVGWCIYPIGYLLGFVGIGGATGMKALNAVYNIADLVNKTAFGLAIYSAAKKDVTAPGYSRMA